MRPVSLTSEPDPLTEAFHRLIADMGLKHEAPDRFVSRPEAAEILGLPTSALEQDAVRGHLGLPVYRFGSRRMYRLSELYRWAAERRSVPPGGGGAP